MIPQVVSWHVRFFRDGKEQGACTVDAPTRLLARMLANDICPQFRLLGITSKISRARSVCPQAKPACKGKAYASA